MSETSEKARAAAKDKAERLVRADPHARTDASGYSPEGALDADVQTGPRPVSRRQFRRGGKVDGMAAAPRADRKRRASGGLTANSLINRDVKSANEDRVGTKHIGGMKSGGRAEAMKERVHKLIGGALTPQQKLGMMRRPVAAPPVMRATGGKVHKDEAQDRKLIHEMGCQCGRCSGGRAMRKEGGKLTAEARKHIKGKNFAGPDRSYPIEDASHARNALARVSQHGSPELQKEVRAKVHAKYPGIGKKNGGAINDGTRPVAGRLARKGGGRTKKGTNVNIIIAPQGAGAAAAPMPRPVAPPVPSPVGLHQGAPPLMPPAGVAPQSMPMRARGGRANDGKLATPGKYPIDAGAGGGLGRLEKAQRAARS